jgi:uncharacterized oxidoreductase
MKMESNTVLITGGATGIGLALAERFLRAGSEVIVCGRREDRLREAKQRHPRLHTRICDVSNEADRRSLLAWATAEFPKLNVLVNNAGVWNPLQIAQPGPFERIHRDIAINLEAPIHLSQLFIQHLHAQENPVIVLVSSGLAFVPMASVPIYCATKAALHSFALSMRQQLSSGPIAVVEIAPPHVNTDLGAPGANASGMPLDEFADAAMAGLARGDPEITCGFSTRASRASRVEIDALFRQLNTPGH